MYGTSQALNALIKTDYWSLQNPELIQTLEWIADKKNSDGGWGENHNSVKALDYVNMESTVIQTGFIIECFLTYEEKYLETYGEPSIFRSVIESAIRYLIANSENGRINEKSYTGILIKPLWFADYALVPEIRTLDALGRYLDILQFTTF